MIVLISLICSFQSLYINTHCFYLSTKIKRSHSKWLENWIQLARHVCLTHTRPRDRSLATNTHNSCPETACNLHISVLKEQSSKWGIIFENLKRGYHSKFTRNSRNSLTGEQCGFKTSKELLQPFFPQNKTYKWSTDLLKPITKSVPSCLRNANLNCNEIITSELLEYLLSSNRWKMRDGQLSREAPAARPDDLGAVP